uniref:CD63 antigen-like n=1 Tax=Scleropages formosus TaxID=113540 RepID=A0A8C9V5U4_SCLFO
MNIIQLCLCISPMKLCGAGLISLGVLVRMAMKDTLSVHSTSILAAPIILIVAGVIIFFTAYFGCCGSWKEHRCLITTFAVLLSFIILSEIGAAVAGYVLRGKVNETVEDGLKNMISQYNRSTDAFRKAVDKMQQHLKCCGANSSTDWANHTLDHQSVPDSCCKNLTSHCGSHALYDGSKVYQMVRLVSVLLIYIYSFIQSNMKACYISVYFLTMKSIHLISITAFSEQAILEALGSRLRGGVEYAGIPYF